MVFYSLFHGKVDEVLEEASIMAWETVIYHHIKRNKRRLNSWRVAIEEKLSSQEDGEDG